MAPDILGDASLCRRMTAVCAKRPPAKACRLGFDPSAGRKAGMNRLLRSERRAGSLRPQPAIASTPPSQPSPNHMPKPGQTVPLPKPITLRTRRSRARQRQGLRCVTVPLHKAQIGELAYRGWLQRSDQAAVEMALFSFLHDALMPKTEVLKELRSRWEPVLPAAAQTPSSPKPTA